MIIIKDKQMNDAIKAIEAMTPKKFEKFLADFGEQQPEIFSYLMANADAIKNADAQDEFVFIFAVIWKCYLNLKIQMNKVSAKELEKKENAHIKGWDKLASITDIKEKEKFVNKFIAQPSLWNFMHDIIIPDPEKPTETNFTSDDDTAIVFACTNLLTALLNDNVNKPVTNN